MLQDMHKHAVASDALESVSTAKSMPNGPISFVVFCPVLQVQGAGFAMVGEQMPVSLVTVAADAVRKAEVAVKAEYLEGGGHSELQILVDNGDGTTQPLQVRCHDCLLMFLLNFVDVFVDDLLMLLLLT